MKSSSCTLSVRWSLASSCPSLAGRGQGMRISSQLPSRAESLQCITNSNPSQCSGRPIDFKRLKLFLPRGIIHPIITLLKSIATAKARSLARTGVWKCIWLEGLPCFLFLSTLCCLLVVHSILLAVICNGLNRFQQCLARLLICGTK